MVIGLIYNATRDKTQTASYKVAARLNELGVRVITDWQEGQDVPDLFIVLGGDGTVMRTARRFGHMGIPFLTINMGRVGFMSELELDELETYADRLLHKDFRLEDRSMLRVTVRSGNDIILTSSALNEAAVLKSGTAKMIHLRLFINGDFFSDYVADGMICATPTGSTAYSLSAGGPVILPDTDAMVLTPVCPYMLALKPLVVGDDKVIKMMAGPNSDACLTIDGQEAFPLSDSDEVEIRRSEHKISFIRFKERMFFDFLGKKLYRGKS